MNSASLTIWCNAAFPPAAMEELMQRVKNHRLIFPKSLSTSNLIGGSADPTLAEADIALGQPDPIQAMDLPRLKWVHLTSAGYTRYDRDDLRQRFRQRGAVMTNSSSVYSEPCAEHAFAMILALARQLPQCLAEQVGPRDWQTPGHRIRSQLLVGQNVVIVGFGAIGRRLAELLQPLHMNVAAVRRRPEPDAVCQVVSTDQLESLLATANHVINILPASPATDGFFDRRRLALMKPGAVFYNIGRGTTVDQAALVDALNQNKLGGAYLDVTDPEPLAPSHPLWTAPNCYITPHTAGGHSDEFERLVRHFADNLDRYVAARPMADQIV
jgi:phosphoglycerate dehydrogenase-like enzyme